MYEFFFIEFSDFPPGLALDALQCGMMAKLRDNARSNLDVCRADDHFLRSVEKLNLNQIKKFKVYGREYIFLSSIM